MRIIVSFVVAFLVAAAAGKCLIPALRRMKAGQSIKEIGPTWHMSKQGTPTMGGLMFIIAIAAAVLTVGWSDIAAGYRGGLFVFLFALVFGIIGYVDDYCKVKKKQNTGLTAPQKFLLQLAAAILFTVLMRYEGYLQNHLYIPFFNVTFSIPWPAYMVFAAFVMVGTVNAVNITDGIDGLATGVTMPVALFFTAVSAYWLHDELGVFASALFGGLCAFLIYNFYPAKVFMGDTGSLFLGGGGMRHGLCPGYSPDSHSGGHHLYCRDPFRHHSGRLFQALPRQADFPHGASPPPPGDGGLERGQALLRLHRDYSGFLRPGLLGRNVPLSHVRAPVPGLSAAVQRRWNDGP